MPWRAALASLRGLHRQARPGDRSQARAGLPSGVTHAGRWCDVFEIPDGKIQRLFVYLDPDYADTDTARYPWLIEQT